MSEPVNVKTSMTLWVGAAISALFAIMLAILGRSLLEWRDFALAQERITLMIARQERMSAMLDRHLELIIEMQKMDNEQNYELRTIKERVQWLINTHAFGMDMKE